MKTIIMNTKDKTVAKNAFFGIFLIVPTPLFCSLKSKERTMQGLAGVVTIPIISENLQLRSVNK